MNQKLSVALLSGGLLAFLTSLSEFLSTHQNWHEMTTPSEVGHIILLVSSFLGALVGALGTQLPRDKNERIGDREPKENIVVTQIEEKKSE